MVREQDDKGRESARGLKTSVAAEERRIERAKGSPLAKGPKRLEERARSAHPKGTMPKRKG